MSRITKQNGRRARDELQDALRRLEPRVARAFARAVRRVRDQATVRDLAAAIERGDIDRAVEIASIAAAMTGAGMQPGSEATFRDELASAFREGADAGQRQLPRAARLTASLDMTAPGALTYLREHVPTLIREIDEETREAVRDMVLRGFEEGRPARQMARDIRQRVGLTRAQSRYVDNFRRQLETGELGNATAPWERRLSATERQVARSLFRNPAPDPARVEAIVNRYTESLVNRRARNIARTETHRAFIEGQDEAWNQAEEEGLLDPTVTRRVWIVTPDDRLRPDHRAVPGMNPGGVGLREPFQTPAGPVMRPGEGPPGFSINCRCATALEIDE